MWPDNETDRDFLNFAGVANTVTEIILKAAGRPVSIGISGAWGVGKSSLIKLVRQSMSAREKASGRPFVFVEFNAWLYQGYDDARAALTEVIATTLETEANIRKKGIAKVGDLLRRVNWLRAAKLTAGSALALALGLPPVGLIGEVWKLGTSLSAKGVDAEAIGNMEKTAGEVTRAAGGLLNARPETSPPKEIELLRAALETALEEMGVTLVVLIDDLDRCLPETTISTLEAIRLFLFLKNSAFVVAADDLMIKHAVKRHFEGVDDQLVTNYFDKLIQVPLRVPRLGTQEVRAYMMLLHVENAILNKDVKETIRSAVCKQLTKTWQGARVDRAFITSTVPNLPNELIGRLDAAERLAPIMATASGVAGNPRLIKRFLNAISIRMAISDAQGVGVDEAVLAKMLLFERLGNPKAYANLLSEVGRHAEGKAVFLADAEASAIAGEDPELKEEWADPFVAEWLALPPSIADRDLRGVLYVSREHAPLITAEDRLSSDGAEVLSALLLKPKEAGSLRPRLARLTRSDMPIVMDRLLERAGQQQEWGAPPILDACLVVASVDPPQGARLAAFLGGRPSVQIKAAIVPRIIKEPWAKPVLEKWNSDKDVAGPVKKAIQEMG
jgi:predicted KAP-like P-loop ATPase